MTFNKLIEQHVLPLPTMYEFAFNNFTSNSGVATAYDAVRNELVAFCHETFEASPQLFASTATPISNIEQWEEAFVANTKDFHTSGKVSAGLGIPLHRLPGKTTYLMPDGTTTSLPANNYAEALKDIKNFVDTLV